MRRFILALAMAAGLATPSLAQGTIRVAVGTTLNQLDPAKTTIGDEYIYVHLVFNGLTRIDRDLTVKPDLAVSWTASEDLKTWTFKLREGVKFHHGKTFDADDVLATMNRILDPATGSRARANLSMIEKIEAPDPQTVRFTLNIPYAGFPDIFGERQLRILAKDRIDAISEEPVGTGPFVFKSWSPGDRLELAKNPGYFEQGLPKLDGVTMRIIPEAAARLAALESGAIDILWNLPYEAVDKFKNHPNVRADGVATATWDGVILNNERAPSTMCACDRRSRRRSTRTPSSSSRCSARVSRPTARSRRAILISTRSSASRSPTSPSRRSCWPTPVYPNGFEVTMQVPQEREQRVRLGVAVRDMARAAGIRINVERVPFASYAAQVAGKAQMYVDGYFARPTIDTAIYPFYHSSGSWNRQLWLYNDERVDEILDTARKTNDEDKRKALFDEFQKIVDETVPSIIAYCGCACERRPQGGRGLPLDTDAVARPEGSHA